MDWLTERTIVSRCDRQPKLVRSGTNVLVTDNTITRRERACDPYWQQVSRSPAMIDPDVRRLIGTGRGVDSAAKVERLMS
jgi:hypothetical protein